VCTNEAEITFRSETVGSHSATIYRRNKIVGRFIFESFDVKHVKVIRPIDSCADEPVSIEVDASEAGKGNLEIEIKDPSSQIVTHECKVNSPQKVQATFLPSLSGIYEIDVEEAPPVSVQPLAQGLQHFDQVLVVSVPQHLSSQLKFHIQAPSGNYNFKSFQRGLSKNIPKL
jgi:hypothetical protein